MFPLLLIALVIIVCIWTSRLSSRFGVPTLLVFIILGMLFGTDGILKIPFDNYEFAEQVCSIALVFIMFYGGFGTSWKMARPVAAKAILLSTLGVVLTAGVTGLFCHFVLHFGVLESFLIGSVISSTDAASVFSILRAKKLNLKYNTASLLEMESGSNDPASYMLTITALSLIYGTAGDTLVGLMVAQILVGLLMGTAISFLCIWVLKKERFSVDGFDTLFVLAAVIGTYAATSLLSGNGYLAVYLLGIILGNNKIINKVPLVHFFDGFTSLAQIIIFFLLGLLAVPSNIPAVILPSLAIALFLTFVARPVAVFAIMGPMKSTLRQMLLVSFCGLRGAASIVFAIIAVVAGTEIRWDLFHIVFCICLLSVSFQGSLLPWAAKKLEMVDDNENVMKTFNDYQAERQMQLMETRIPAGHPWAGQTIGELNVVVDTLIVMVIRGGENLLPRGDTVIEAGDLLVFGGKPYEGKGDVALEEILVEGKHPWTDRLLKDIPLSDEELVVILRHADGATSIPHGDTRVQSGDTLVVRTIA